MKKSQPLIYFISVSFLESEPQGEKGNSSRCPHQVKTLSPSTTLSSCPITADQSRRSLSSWSSLAFVKLRGGAWAGGSEDRKQSRGRKEVRKKLDGSLTLLTPSPTSLQESNTTFPKIFTVSLN